MKGGGDDELFSYRNKFLSKHGNLVSTIEAIIAADDEADGAQTNA